MDAARPVVRRAVAAFPREVAVVVAFPRAFAVARTFARARVAVPLFGVGFARFVADARFAVVAVAARFARGPVGRVGRFARFAVDARSLATGRFAGDVRLAGLEARGFALPEALRVAAELALPDARAGRTLGLFEVFFAAMPAR